MHPESTSSHSIHNTERYLFCSSGPVRKSSSISLVLCNGIIRLITWSWPSKIVSYYGVSMHSVCILCACTYILWTRSKYGDGEAVPANGIGANWPYDVCVLTLYVWMYSQWGYTLGQFWEISCWRVWSPIRTEYSAQCRGVRMCPDVHSAHAPCSDVVVVNAMSWCWQLLSDLPCWLILLLSGYGRWSAKSTILCPPYSVQSGYRGLGCCYSVSRQDTERH